MRTALDYSPLFRTSVGFDRVLDLMEAASRTTADNFPPFDSVKLGEDSYRVTLAVAGFSPEELSITAQANLLIVQGERQSEGEGEYLHKGIANRAFTRRFELAQHVQVTGAQLVNGLLSIDLKREVPEAMKPRRIEIGANTAPGAVRQIHGEAA